MVLWAGWPFFVRGAKSLVTRHLNMFTLIALGTGVAYVYSVVAAFAPGVFPAAFRGHDGAVAVYFEAAAVITVLVLLGQVLELTGLRASAWPAPSGLCPSALAPTSARRVTPDGGMTRTSRSTPSRSATACGCGRATRSRSTARSSRAARTGRRVRW